MNLSKINSILYFRYEEKTKDANHIELKEFHTDTIIEPFRIRPVKSIRFTSMEERSELLEEAGYNPFLLKAKDVVIDLLTDSGTGAMSFGQWTGMVSSDESYAGSSSFYKLEDTVGNCVGYAIFFIPTQSCRLQ